VRGVLAGNAFAADLVREPRDDTDVGHEGGRVAEFRTETLEQAPELAQTSFEMREDRLQDVLVGCGLGPVEQVVDGA
jgi:hypothetical protein